MLIEKGTDKSYQSKNRESEYRIDMQPKVFHGANGVRQYVLGYVQVCGDSVISCMSYDNPLKAIFLRRITRCICKVLNMKFWITNGL